MASLSICTHGLHVSVLATDSELLAKALPYLPPQADHSTRCHSPQSREYFLLRNRIGRDCARNIPGECGSKNQANQALYELYADSRLLIRTCQLATALLAFESDLQQYVAQMASGAVFVHAGVVAWKGRAIVIPGRSFTGKTTLVAALLKAGAVYYSDEYAVIDPSGRVHPYARPLGIRDPETGIPSRCGVEQLHANRGTEPIRVELVVVTAYSEGATWNPTVLSRGHAVLELLKNTIAVRRQPRSTLTILSRAVAGAVTVKDIRGEASRVAEAILQRCD